MKALLASLLLISTLAVGLASTANAGVCSNPAWVDLALDDNRT